MRRIQDLPMDQKNRLERMLVYASSYVFPEIHTLELWHIPWLAWVDTCMVLMVICGYRSPHTRIRAVKLLRVGILWKMYVEEQAA